MKAAAAFATTALFLIGTRTGPLAIFGPFGLDGWRWCAYVIFPLIFALLWLTRRPAESAAGPESASPTLGRPARIALLLTAVATSFVLYAPTLKPYLIDEYDFYGLARTYFPHVLGRVFTPGAAYFHHGEFRPLHTLSYVLDWWVWDDWRVGPHITTLTIFGAVVYLVGLLAFRLTGSVSSAVIAASLFGLHPANPEVAIWALARSDSLCALGYVGSLLGLIAYLRKRRRLSLTLSLIGFVIALLAKEMAVTLPLAAAFVVLMLPEGRRLAARNKMTLIGAYWAVLVLFFMAQFFARHGTLGLKYGVVFTPRFMLGSLASSAWWYVFFPLIDPLVSGATPRVVLALVFTLPVVALFLSRLRAPIPHALVLTAVTMLPIAPVMEITPWLANGRYVHLPVVFLSIALGVAFAQGLWRGSRLRRVAAGAMLVGTLAGYATATAVNTAPWVETGRVSATLPVHARSLAGMAQDVSRIYIWGTTSHPWNPAPLGLPSAFLYDFWGARLAVLDNDARRLEWTVNGERWKGGRVWDDHINVTERPQLDHWPRPHDVIATPSARVLVRRPETGEVRNVTEPIRTALSQPCAVHPPRLDLLAETSIRTWGLAEPVTMTVAWVPSWCDEATLRLTVKALAAPHPYANWLTFAWEGHDAAGQLTRTSFLLAPTVDGVAHDYTIPLGRDPRWMLLRDIARITLELPRYPATLVIDGFRVQRGPGA